MIRIVEKEPYKHFNSWNNRECLMYPTIMIKNGKEYFVFNRREPNGEYEEKENKKSMELLKRTDGKYTKFYGEYDNPFEMLKEIIKEKDMIISNSQNFDNKTEKEYITDFHGNRENYASAFMYRIYDRKLENILKKIVDYINNKEWNIAEKILIENEKLYSDFNMEKDTIQEPKDVHKSDMLDSNSNEEEEELET